jgi:hypothetical protein
VSEHREHFGTPRPFNDETRDFFVQWASGALDDPNAAFHVEVVRVDVATNVRERHRRHMAAIERER